MAKATFRPKLTQNKNEFVTHFVQKCLETRENEQNVVLNGSSGALGNRSDFAAGHDNS